MTLPVRPSYMCVHDKSISVLMILDHFKAIMKPLNLDHLKPIRFLFLGPAD